ncbi:hypothetical protein KKA53_03235 [Candidatus Dependentiae bacterium]|nr:hypothetical protein [Candidatus Dependentiae bacterium]
MLRLVRVLWGDLTRDELKKFGILSVAMMLIVGNYWMLRVTKDALFDVLVGFRQWQPVAKMISVLVMVVVVLGYSKLVDMLRRHHLIYLVCSFYGVTFILLSYLATNPELLAVSSTSLIYPLVSWIPSKIPGGGIGWFAYVFLESYGSLLIAVFYSFIASVMTTGLAKKGYGMMMSITQFGTLSGVLISMFFVERVGIPMLYFFGGIVVLSAPFIIRYYISQFPEDIASTQEAVAGKKNKTGFFEGLRLIATRPYIMGVFVVVTAYEIISTIVEYQMSWIAVGIYSPEQFTVFRTYQGLGINLLALLFAIIGTSFFMRRLGLKFCLMAFPITIGVVVTANYLVRLSGAGNTTLMWVLMLATVAIKGLNYALNKPTSEVMYIPTSKDVKFKSKGWIDVFGNRSTKGVGATVSKSLGHSLPVLLMYGTIISLGIVGVWLLIAQFVGNKFNKLQEQDAIVE